MKSLEVTAPEGYEIDVVNSSIYKIVFRELKKDVIERVNSLEDAIKDLGEEHEDVKQLRLLYSVQGITRKIIAEQEIVIMVKALNEGWIPDFENGLWDKWFIWWKFESGKPRFDNVYIRNSYADSSSRLCTKSKELALHLAKIAEKQFVEYISY